MKIMNCFSPTVLKNLMVVPCGQCLACKVAKTREWTMRLIHEQQYYDKFCFITLTYSDENLPDGGSLVRQDLQKFYKRLRKNLQEKDKYLDLKHFSCGEYGAKRHRPHYHSILFGLSILDHVIDRDCNVLQGPLKDAWWYGLVNIGTATEDSIRYTTGYVNEKQYRQKKFEQYTSKNLVPPFQLSSQGLGYRWAKDHEQDLVSDLNVRVQGQRRSIPRYYKQKLKISSESLEALARDMDETNRLRLMNMGFKNPQEMYEYMIKERMQRCNSLKNRFEMRFIRNSKF